MYHTATEMKVVHILSVVVSALKSVSGDEIKFIFYGKMRNIMDFCVLRSQRTVYILSELRQW